MTPLSRDLAMADSAGNPSKPGLARSFSLKIRQGLDTVAILANLAARM
jgi:hypothetical protein